VGSILKIVPVDEFDLDYFESAIENVEQFEIDGEVIPSDERIAIDKLAIAALKRGLAALTPAQKKRSRWATHAEVRKAVKAAAASQGFDFEGGPGRSNFWQFSLEKSGDDPNVLTSALLVNGSVDKHDGDTFETFYCTGTDDALCAVAAELSKLAGPQVSFAAEEYSWAEVTQLFVDGAAVTATPPKAARKPVRKPARKAARKPVRKAARKPARKATRKPARKRTTRKR
jgi:hypothetical protein